MVGDGVNDAGAMAAASCSIAIAPRDLVVQQCADSTLLHANLGLIPTALAFAKRCQKIIRQNIVWALCYNLTAVPFALAGLLPPWLAALGMSASSVLVVLNANRLRWIGD
jgi:Cu2+-exporting ATPase